MAVLSWYDVPVLTSLQKGKNEENVEHNHLESLMPKVTFWTKFAFLQ